MKRCWTLLGMLALSACGGSPAPDLYVLRASDAPLSCKASGRSIVVERPGAADEYDTRRMAILLDGNHLTYYVGANWASPFPDQLQNFMNDRLANDGRLQVAQAGNAGAAAVLKLTIREAEVTNIDAPLVHLRLSGTITTAGRQLRIDTTQTVAAQENHMPEIVDAYNKAAAQAIDDIFTKMKLRCN